MAQYVDYLNSTPYIYINPALTISFHNGVIRKQNPQANIWAEEKCERRVETATQRETS